jgi:hypothetical protein
MRCIEPDLHEDSKPVSLSPHLPPTRVGEPAWQLVRDSPNNCQTGTGLRIAPSHPLRCRGATSVETLRLPPCSSRFVFRNPRHIAYQATSRSPSKHAHTYLNIVSFEHTTQVDSARSRRSHPRTNHRFSFLRTPVEHGAYLWKAATPKHILCRPPTLHAYPPRTYLNEGELARIGING